MEMRRYNLLSSQKERLTRDIEVLEAEISRLESAEKDEDSD